MNTTVRPLECDRRDKVSVLVAERTPLMGRLVSDALSRDKSLVVIDVAERAVLPLAIELSPDVVVASSIINGDSLGVFELLNQLRACLPATRVVVLLDLSERFTVVEAFRGGARGVFCRSDSLRLLARCVRRVFEGELWISTKQLEFILETLLEAPATRLVDARGIALLSNREQEVVRWLVEGFTNREIAQQLKISENTVKNYLFRIFDKLGVSSRIEVVIYAANQRAANNPPDLDRIGNGLNDSRRTFKRRPTRLLSSASATKAAADTDVA
jgi:two-component system nitrate/nitrite response regulator NarL